MHINLIIATFVAASVAHASKSDFAKTCPPSQCGSFPIRFPLRLQSDNPRCSLEGLDLTCSPDNRTLHLPAFPQFKITNISYAWQFITLDIGSISLSSFQSSPCPLQNLSSVVNSLAWSVQGRYDVEAFRAIFLRCSKKISPVPNPTWNYRIAGPIPSCYEKEKYFVYVADSYEHMDVLGHDCEMLWTGGQIPGGQDPYSFLWHHGFRNIIDDLIAQKEVKVNLSWYPVGKWAYDCMQCEQKGGTVGLIGEGMRPFA